MRIASTTLLLALPVLSVAACDGGSPDRDADPGVPVVLDEWHPLMDQYGDKAYARNVWDMVAFDGKLFIGSGNSANSGPDRNAGPAPIWSYDPVTDVWTEEFRVDDEQVDVFHVIAGELYTPGHDPRESWDLGNFYRRAPGGTWTKVRTIPGGIHTYDLGAYEGRLWAALGTDGTQPSMASSADGGQTWNLHPVDPDETWDIHPSRIYHLMRLGETLLACGVPGMNRNPSDPSPRARIEGHHNVYAWNGEAFVASPVDFFPGLEERYQEAPRFPYSSRKISRSHEFGGRTYYLAGSTWNDHQFLPYALMVADPSGRIAGVPLSSGASPWDITSTADAVYVLLGTPLPAGRWRVSVIGSRGNDTWTEVVGFEAGTFARSFAFLDGDLYFGMGTEISDPALPSALAGPGNRPTPEHLEEATATWNQEVSPLAGTIYRVRATQLRPVAGN